MRNNLHKWGTYRIFYHNWRIAGPRTDKVEEIPWTCTNITVRARNQEEAERKAIKFWRQGEFGEMSIIVLPVERYHE